MTHAYAHIFEQYREFADLGDEERKHWICRERWIDLPQSKRALGLLEQIFNYPQRGRMPCMLLYGATDLGKSAILARFIEQHPSTYDTRQGISSMPIVCVEMAPEPLEPDFYVQILLALKHPGFEHYSVKALRSMVLELLKESNARMLVLDEIDKMLAGTPRQQRIFLNTIRFLTNSLRLPIVCAGTETARLAFATDPNLADRFAAVELFPWRNDTSLRQLLTSFAGLLPLRKPSELDTPEFRRQVIAMTEGVTGRIFKLIETLALSAINSKKEMIDTTSLDDPGLLLPLLSMQMIDERKRSRSGMRH